jgi:hypothetical protein
MDQKKGKAYEINLMRQVQDISTFKAVDGAILMSFNPKSEDEQVMNLSGFAPGFYYTQIRTSQGIVILKIVMG